MTSFRPMIKESFTHYRTKKAVIVVDKYTELVKVDLEKNIQAEISWLHPEKS